MFDEKEFKENTQQTVQHACMGSWPRLKPVGDAKVFKSSLAPFYAGEHLYEIWWGPSGKQLNDKLTFNIV